MLLIKIQVLKKHNLAAVKRPGKKARNGAREDLPL